jgi:tight adherence protein C
MFSSLYSLLESQFGVLTPTMILGTLGLIMIMGVLPFLIVRPKEPFDKVKMQRVARAPLEVETAKKSAIKLRVMSRVEKLQRYAAFLEPKNPEDLNNYRMKLVRGGYRNKTDLRTFHFLQLVCGIAGLILAISYVIYLSYMGDLPIEKIPIYITFGGVFGFYLPKIMLFRATTSRKAEIIAGFPDALDLMMISIEAGQSMDQSIYRIAKETRHSFPALADELDVVNQEIKAGKDRVTVLKEFANRIDNTDISSFVGTLVQSITYGTPMSEALRMYSSEMRDKRAMRAEEAANKIPTKLTLITLIFTMPPIMLLMMGPMLYEFAN